MLLLLTTHSPPGALSWVLAVDPFPVDSSATLTLRLKAAWICRTSWWAEVLGAWPGDSGVAHSWLVRADLSVYLSQRIQESCQSGTKWLVETQVKARRRKRGAQKGSGPPARSLSQRGARLSVAAPARPALDPRGREQHRLSSPTGPHAHPRRRSRREAAFRSPYSSAEPLCSPRYVR